MAEEIQEDEYEKELEAELANAPTSDRKILRSIVNKFKGAAAGGRRTASQAALAAKAGIMMAKLTRLSQDSMKCYWDEHSNTPNRSPDYGRALELNARATRICDEIIAAWPQQSLSLMPMKEKLIAQRKDIELQKIGKIVDPAILMEKKGEMHA